MSHPYIRIRPNSSPRELQLKSVSNLLYNRLVTRMTWLWVVLYTHAFLSSQNLISEDELNKQTQLHIKSCS